MRQRVVYFVMIWVAVTSVSAQESAIKVDTNLWHIGTPHFIVGRSQFDAGNEVFYSIGTR